MSSPIAFNVSAGSPYSASPTIKRQALDENPDLSLSFGKSSQISVVENTIISKLQSKFMRSQYFSKIGSDSYVFVTPKLHPSAVDEFSEETSDTYAEQFKESWAHEGKLPHSEGLGRMPDVVTDAELPCHIFELAASTYFLMLRDQESQSVIFAGGPGSGKSVAQSLFAQQLVDLSSQVKKKSKVLSGVKKMETVLQAFGHAELPKTQNASRFGRYTEYQYNRLGKMVGVKLADYCFDRQRVVKESDRNFNVFYLLTDHAPDEERQALHLLDGSGAFFFLQQLSAAEASAGDTLSRSKSLTRKFSLGRKASTVTRNRSVVKRNGAQEVADGPGFYDELSKHFKSLGIGRRTHAQINQVLAGILHLGNLTFVDDLDSPNEPCKIKNMDELEIAASLLGLRTTVLESILTYKTKTIAREVCSVYLNSEGAKEQRNALCKSIYTLVFKWIITHINERLCQDESTYDYFISTVDFPGLITADMDGKKALGFDGFLSNYANEVLFRHTQIRLVEERVEELSTDGIKVNSFQFPNNSKIVKLLWDAPDRGFFAVLGECGLKAGDTKGLLQKLEDSASGGRKSKNGQLKLPENSPFIPNSECRSLSNYGHSTFGIRHYSDLAEYDLFDFLDSNADMIDGDFVSLFRGISGPGEQAGSSNNFAAHLFSSEKIGLEAETSKTGMVSASLSQMPVRKPSMKRKASKKGRHAEPDISKPDSGPESPKAHVGPLISNAVRESLDDLISVLENSKHWSVFCLAPNDNSTNILNTPTVLRQVRALGLASLAQQRSVANYAPRGMSFETFLEDYAALFPDIKQTGSPKSRVQAIAAVAEWPERDYRTGKSKIFLSEEAWSWLETGMRLKDGTSFIQEVQKYRDDGEDLESNIDAMTEADYNQNNTDFSVPNDLKASGVVVNSGERKEFVEKVVKMTSSRRNWLCLTWCCTWWIPSFTLSLCGKMKRTDIQMAWREKVTICILIFLCCAVFLFIIIGIRYVICVPKPIKSQDEVNGMGKPWVYAYGYYYNLNDVYNYHLASYGPSSSLAAGLNFLPFTFDQAFQGDVSVLFMKNNSWSTLCPGLPQPQAGWDNLDGANFNNQNRAKSFLAPYIPYHNYGGSPFLAYMNQYVRGQIGWQTADLQMKANEAKKFIVIYNNVYYVTPYKNIDSASRPFTEDVNNILLSGGNQIDYSKRWTALNATNGAYISNVLTCMNNMFYVGTIDTRESAQCAASQAVLLGATCLLGLIIVVKFLTAIRFTRKKEPEPHNNFAICFVPCYTEGQESLSKTIESLAVMRYDDKRKLLFVVCDGMVIGAGNDRPTPRIVLDILGVDPSLDPEPFAFQSLGEGNKQYNMAKVYSGLYDVRGHSVPFIVVVKVGGPSERVKPGNRGKRDSQLILMNFLGHALQDSGLSPLEVELYRQIQYVIGVRPSFYEFVLMVDADTYVERDALNKFVSIMIQDTKVVGLCGETRISNQDMSIITMIQVYEYFISHHLSKSFESLFGTVTCLPGCFSIYRVQGMKDEKMSPMLVTPGLLTDYSENTVDTLHKKNLLHLGEDRYLSTLLLKHFPMMKTSFTNDAICLTVAPDRWSVLLSQRRRWINSTVHNLVELLSLNQMCGFCCFSMRFIVMFDLFSTFILPATIFYIAYLIFAVVTGLEGDVMFSVYVLCGVYGLQVIIFLLQREWQMIAWMIIYIIGLPISSFVIPVYSFWNMDDFSWGNTRVVIGDGQKTVYVSDTQPFDPKSIPLVKWQEVEEQMKPDYMLNERKSDFDVQSMHSGIRPMYYGDSPPQMIPMPGYVDPAAVNRNSMFFGGVGPAIRAGSEISSGRAYEPGSLMPSDTQLFSEIRNILATADLMTITKKKIREQLSLLFGVDLAPKKQTINRYIDDILQGKT